MSKKLHLILILTISIFSTACSSSENNSIISSEELKTLQFKVDKEKEIFNKYHFYSDEKVDLTDPANIEKYRNLDLDKFEKDLKEKTEIIEKVFTPVTKEELEIKRKELNERTDIDISLFQPAKKYLLDVKNPEKEVRYYDPNTASG
ncbi:hypothetical protein [Myroides odoratimimus]|uniref:hypothetical protein n=1 Tax=Myroides odoratimimus TaxID=76832 RepID=UPI00046A3BFF|nr:hypothetical protein [Myroides odoratimimus]